MHYKLLSKYTLFGGMQISQALLSPTLYANYGASKLSFKTTNSLGYNLHIGGSMPMHKLISIGFYGLYAHSTDSFKLYREYLISPISFAFQQKNIMLESRPCTPSCRL